MCRLEFKDFKATFKKMWEAWHRMPDNQLIGVAPDNSRIVLKFDRNRDLNGARYQGNIAIPVIIETTGLPASAEHVLVFDNDRKVWFLPCGKTHFEWCDQRSSRKH